MGYGVKYKGMLQMTFPSEAEAKKYVKRAKADPNAKASEFGIFKI